MRITVQADPALWSCVSACLGHHAQAFEKIAAFCGCYSRQMLLLCHKKRGVRRQVSSARTDALLLLIFGDGEITIAGEQVLIQVAKPVLLLKPPRADPRAGGFHYGLVVYLIPLVPPLWGILPNSLRQQGLSSNSLCRLGR